MSTGAEMEASGNWSTYSLLSFDESIRYYSNIVGKYGIPVQNALKKLAGVELDYICSTHGPVWHEQLFRMSINTLALKYNPPFYNFIKTTSNEQEPYIQRSRSHKDKCSSPEMHQRYETPHLCYASCELHPAPQPTATYLLP